MVGARNLSLAVAIVGLLLIGGLIFYFQGREEVESGILVINIGRESFTLEGFEFHVYADNYGESTITGDEEHNFIFLITESLEKLSESSEHLAEGELTDVSFGAEWRTVGRNPQLLLDSGITGIHSFTASFADSDYLITDAVNLRLQPNEIAGGRITGRIEGTVSAIDTTDSSRGEISLSGSFDLPYIEHF